MSFRITCPTCRSHLAVERALIGSKVTCSVCKTALAVANSTQSRATALPKTDFQSLPSVTPSTTATSSPFRKPPQKKQANDTAIIATAIIGLSTLVLVVGGSITFQFVKNHRSERLRASGNEPAAPPVPQPDSVATGNISSSDNPTTVPPSQTNTSTESFSNFQRPREITPPSDAGLQRVHIPEGFSIAVPAGFTAAPRAINESNTIYAMIWSDGTLLRFLITRDQSISEDSPVPPIHASTSRDGKQIIHIVSSSPSLGYSETFKLDGMNVCFAEMQQDVSHDDMSEQLQFMFSGAMTPEMKRQYAHLMEKKVAYRATVMMKAMDKKRTLEVMIAAERGQPFRAPDDWIEILKTVRHESLPNESFVPAPFVPRQ